MYSAHQGNQALRTVVSAPTADYVRDGKPASFWGLQGSASLRDRELVLTVVNPDVSHARETEIVIRGAAVSSGTLTVLAGSDLHAHNSFEQPNEVTPQEKEVRATGKIVEIQIPAASVTKLTLTLV
jgi:alpha-N-arabinofuranosidase